MVDLKEEQEYTKLRKLAQELHIPIPVAFWTFDVFDKDGKLIQRHKQRSHSWTRNAYNSIFSRIAKKNVSDGTFGAGKLSIKDTGGTLRSGAGSVSHFTGGNYDTPNDSDGILTPAAQIDKGIVVGSGTTAESFEDYVLQTPITEGTGAGQLNAVASENHSMSYAALVLKDEQVRYFNNNSGGDVSINEVAIYDGIYAAGGGRYNACMTRDKLGATVTVPDTGQVKVTYTIQLTYPS